MSRGFQLKITNLTSQPLIFEFFDHHMKPIKNYDFAWRNCSYSPGFKINKIRGVKEMHISLDLSRITASEYEKAEIIMVDLYITEEEWRFGFNLVTILFAFSVLVFLYLLVKLKSFFTT